MGAVRTFNDLANLCGPCNRRLKIIDARFATLYGFSEITLRRLSLITGFHFQHEVQPRLNIHYDRDVTKGWGFLPTQVHPELFSRPTGKLLTFIIIYFP